MAKKVKREEVKPEEVKEEKAKRVKVSIDYAQNPFVVVVGSSAKVVSASSDLDSALKHVQESLPVKKQTKAFIGQFFPVAVETRVKLKSDE